MKIFLCLYIIYLCSVHFIISVIPNWNISEIGENLLPEGQDSYDYEYTKELHYVYLTMKKHFYRNGDKIENSTTIIMDINTDISKGHCERTDGNMNFTNIESFYFLKNKFYICPKGKYHLYDFTNGHYIVPNEFKDNGHFELKCYYHVKSSVFSVFYLMNGDTYAWYPTYVKGGNEITLNVKKSGVADNFYDFKLDENEIPDKSENYYMMALIKKDSNLTIYTLETQLKSDYQGANQINSPFHLDIIRTYVQAYFKSSSNDFYFISYDNINNFYSGYSTWAAEKLNVLTDIQFVKAKIDFEFLEEDVEIVEMNFIYHNRFVYYIMQSKNYDKKYYGIYDVKLNKTVFNTDEEIINYFPHSELEMMAETKTSLYKICAMQGSNGCTDYCPKEYLLDTEKNQCSESSSCLNGKFKLMPSGVCDNKCDPNYFIYNDNKECGLCRDLDPDNKYKLVGGQSCLSSIGNYMEYFNKNLFLLKCKSGFIIENDDCVKHKNCYDLCKPNQCTDESSDENNQHCLSCIDGYYLEENNCKEKCSNGYFIKPGNECEKCSLNNCQKYQDNNETCLCEICENLYFLIDSKCEKCSNDCYGCIDNPDKCTDCQNSFLFENKCYQCQGEFCQKFIDEKKCACDICNDGYYNRNYLCEKCLDNCKTCDNNETCKSCYDNYFINKNGTCSECITSNCKIYKLDGCECEACEEGYFLNDQQCKKCNDTCKTCEGNENNCTICSKNSFMNENNICEKCDDTCKTCEGNKYNCTICVENSFMNEDNICEKCDDSCKTCEGYKSNCTSCDENRFLNENNTCESCDDSCKDCSLNKTNCTSCKDGKYLDGNKCNECDSVCKTCENENECLSCENGTYLIFDDFNKTCVQNCTTSGRDFNEDHTACIPKKESNSTGGNETSKGDDDLLLWIFIIILGIILLIISIIICRKCCNNKTNSAFIEEITTDIDDDNLIKDVN